jgi:hypothetical protein
MSMAIYLCWIGFKSLFSAFKKTDKAKIQEPPVIGRKTLLKSFLQGFLTNALNPKVLIFYMAAFPQFIPMGENAAAYGFLLITIHSVMNMLWFPDMVILFLKYGAASEKPARTEISEPPKVHSQITALTLCSQHQPSTLRKPPIRMSNLASDPTNGLKQPASLLLPL